MISADDAIVSARHWAATRGDKLWDDRTLTVDQEVIEGHHVWSVKAIEALSVDPALAWMEEPQAMLDYLVDSTTGDVIGIRTERSTMLSGRRN